MMSMSLQLAEFTAKLRLQEEILKDAPRSIREGKLKRVSGIVLEVEGLPMSIGSGATIVSQVVMRVLMPSASVLMAVLLT